MSNLNTNRILIDSIFKFISPVFIWVETMKKKFGNEKFQLLKIFKLLKQIRNEVSHFDTTQNERNESLFIKIVVIYERFGLDLIEKSVEIQKLWNDLHNDYTKTSFIMKLKAKVQNIKINYHGNYQDNLYLFESILFTILNPNENNKYQYQILINIIFQYVSSVIIWREEMINIERVNSKLFQLVNEIKYRICHLSIFNNTNCTYLGEILKSIFLIYNCFGIDLTYFNSQINEIDFETIPLCREYKENEIREEIIDILKNQNDMRRNYYLIFRNIIDQIIGKPITHISINMESAVDEKENRIDFIKDKNVSDHLSIEINDDNENFIGGKMISNKTPNDDKTSVCEMIICCILLSGLIYGAFKLYKLWKELFLTAINY